MTALTTPQLAYWRRTVQPFPVWAWVHRPSVVLAARYTTTMVPYPVTQLPFDTVTAGGYAQVREGMTVLLGSIPGGDQYGRSRVRYDAGAGTACSSTLLYVQRSSIGTRDGELVVGTGVYITVLDLRQIWAIPPHITQLGAMYKDGNRAFSAAIHQRPVANAGPDVLMVVPAGQTSAAVQFGQTASYAMHPDAAGISSYAWDFKDGSPATASSASPGAVTFPLGHRYISLTVTDSMGTAHTAYALVAVVDEDDPDLLGGFDITRHTERADGQEMSIQLSEPLPFAQYPDGTEVLVCTQPAPQLAGLAGREHMLFAGWIQGEEHDVQAQAGGLTSRSTLLLADVAGRLSALTGFNLTIERDSAPASWVQMKSATMDRVIHHVLDWHSSALTRADFIRSTTGETYALAGVDVDGGSLYDMADTKAQAIAHKLACDRYGRLAVRPDPLLQPDYAQAALYGLIGRTTIVQAQLTEADWTAYRFSYARPPRVHWLWGEALTVNTQDFDQLTSQGALYVVAPSLVPGQGVSEQRTGKQLVSNIHELKLREGNRYAARLNAREGYFEVPVRQGGPAIHPADMEWVRFTVSSATAAPRGRVYDGERFLPIETRYQYSVGQGVRRVSVLLERETSGVPAEQYFPPDSTYAPLPVGFSYGGGWSPVIMSEPNLLYPPNNVLPLKLFAVSPDGRVCRAWIDVATGEGTYEEVTSLPTACYFAASDPWDHRRKFFCCEDGIYRVMNLWHAGTISYTKVQGDSTWDNEGDAAHFIAFSPTRKGYIITVSGDGAVAISTNAGTTWTRHDLPNAVSKPPSNALSMFGNGGQVAVSPWNNAKSESDGRVYALGWNDTFPGLYRSTNWGRTWTEVEDITAESGYPSFTTGRLVVPYLKPDGSPNRNGGSQHVICLAGYPAGDAGPFGLYRSQNGGSSWVMQYAPHPASTEAGFTWGPPMLARHIVSTAAPGVAYLVVAHQTEESETEQRRIYLLRAEDQWKRVAAGTDDFDEDPVATPVLTGDPGGMIYDGLGGGGAVAWGGSAELLLVFGWGCQYTLDGGESWMNITNKLPWSGSTAYADWCLSDYIPRA